jgi:PDZ domain
MAIVKGHRRLTCAIVVLTLLGSASTGFSQSFLDKLESVVRDKLNAPAADSKSTVDAKSAPEELPAPNRPKTTKPANSPNAGSTSGVPANNPGNSTKLPSILENKAAVLSSQDAEGTLQLAPSEGSPDALQTAEPAGVYLGLEVEELVGGGIGVRVSGLSERSPAWKAGFKVGDLLQAIDGHAIADIDGMADRLRRVIPGKPTKFLIKRGGRNLELVAVLQNAALASRLGATTDLVDGPISGPAVLGVLASDLTPAFRSQFGLAVYSGAAVTNVTPGSPAYRAGIRPGDAIVEINGAPINSGDDLIRWMSVAQIGQPAELLVYRGTQPSTLSVVLSGEPTDLVLNERPRTSARPTVGGPNRSDNALQAEVEQLRAELEQTQRQLQQTQKRLEQVLQQLEQNR